MKRKGFTLVELLAVIVVLAIISIITIPMIGNVIDESKKKALEVSANGLVEAASYYTINHDGVTEFVFDENKKGETIKGEQLDYKGSIEGTGKLYIDSEGDISLCLVDDKYYVYKNYNSGIYVGEVKDNSCIIGYDVLTNKYVAMLDDGTGQVSNVYSKDEVNNLIDNLQNQISDNSNNINSLQTSIDNINNNLLDRGSCELLFQTTSTSTTITEVPSLSNYKYIYLLGISSDAKNSLIIPTELFVADTTNFFDFVSGNWGAITTYYSRFKVWYVNDTTIKTLIVNNNYVGTLYVYGIK